MQSHEAKRQRVEKPRASSENVLPFPSTSVAETNDADERYDADANNSPSRHTPGRTPGFNIQRSRSFGDLGVESAERDGLERGKSELATSPADRDARGDDVLDPRAVAQAPSSVHATPRRRHRRVDSLGGEDITLSPGELGGSQYIMSPGDALANTLSRSESTVSDGQSALPSSVEEVAALELRQPQRLYPIFVKGRKIVHLVRHGQSTYNEAISGPGSWDEPNIFDAPLTTLGVNQARGLGGFLAKLPKDAVWVTSALTRAMETCVHGYKSSLEVKYAQKRRAAAVNEAAGGTACANTAGRPPLAGRSKSRLSHGGKGSRAAAGRSSDENGYADDGGSEDAVPMAGTTPAPGRGCLEDADADAGASGGRAVARMLSDEKTPAPMAAKRTLSAELGELAPDAVGASPSDTLEFDTAEMAAWGERVIVHPHLSEKVSTSGDIGRNKGILMNEFPLLALGLSRLPGDVWWYSQVHRPNDAERETFQSHEPSHKFKERVDRFRHWLMSREDKVFVVFGHSTFFKELTGGHKSMKNCEVFSYHL